MTKKSFSEVTEDSQLAAKAASLLTLRSLYDEHAASLYDIEARVRTGFANAIVVAAELFSEENQQRVIDTMKGRYINDCLLDTAPTIFVKTRMVDPYSKLSLDDTENLMNLNVRILGYSFKLLRTLRGDNSVLMVNASGRAFTEYKVGDIRFPPNVWDLLDDLTPNTVIYPTGKLLTSMVPSDVPTTNGFYNQIIVDTDYITTDVDIEDKISEISTVMHGLQFISSATGNGQTFEWVNVDE